VQPNAASFARRLVLPCRAGTTPGRTDTGTGPLASLLTSRSTSGLPVMLTGHWSTCSWQRPRCDPGCSGNGQAYVEGVGSRHVVLLKSVNRERGRKVSVSPCLRYRPPHEALPAALRATAWVVEGSSRHAHRAGWGEAVACLAERALAKGQHLGWLHLEDQCPAVLVLEAAVSDLIAPAPVPLPSPGAC
jgi:hypothetical protein